MPQCFLHHTGDSTLTLPQGGDYQDCHDKPWAESAECMLGEKM